MEGRETPNEGWLSTGLVRKIGNGRETSFWNDNWVGEGNLISNFTRLFNITTSKDTRISDSGFWRNGTWIWHFSWEQELLDNLMQLIHTWSSNQNNNDSWLWLGDSSCIYSVNSAYRLINNSVSLADQKFYKSFGDKNTPLKVAAFCWRANFDRLPTATNLLKRGISINNNNLSCLFCNSAA